MPWEWYLTSFTVGVVLGYYIKSRMTTIVMTV